MPKFVASRSTVDQAIQRAQDFLLSTQAPDGHWRGGRAGGTTHTPPHPPPLPPPRRAFSGIRRGGFPPVVPPLGAARSLIRRAGGPVAANVFTKITLALFGEYDWAGGAAMPGGVMLLPRRF